MTFVYLCCYLYIHASNIEQDNEEEAEYYMNEAAQKRGAQEDNNHNYGLPPPLASRNKNPPPPAEPRQYNSGFYRMSRGIAIARKRKPISSSKPTEVGDRAILFSESPEPVVVRRRRSTVFETPEPNERVRKKTLPILIGTNTHKPRRKRASTVLETPPPEEMPSTVNTAVLAVNDQLPPTREPSHSEDSVSIVFETPEPESPIIFISTNISSKAQTPPVSALSRPQQVSTLRNYESPKPIACQTPEPPLDMSLGDLLESQPSTTKQDTDPEPLLNQGFELFPVVKPGVRRSVRIYTQASRQASTHLAPPYQPILVPDTPPNGISGQLKQKQPKKAGNTNLKLKKQKGIVSRMLMQPQYMSRLVFFYIYWQ